MRRTGILFLLLPAPALAATWTVSANGGDFDSLEEALDEASSGDTIVLGAGDWPFVLVDEPVELTIRGGADPGSVHLAGLAVVDADAVVTVEDLSFVDARTAVEVVGGTVHLSGVYVDGGGAPDGGFAIAAREGARVTVADSSIRRTVSDHAVVSAEGGSTVSMSGVEVSDCVALAGGVVRAEGGATLELDAVRFARNHSAGAGGALAVDGAVAVAEDVVFTGNTAVAGGAAWVGNGGVLEVRDAYFSGNVAEEDGGHLAVAQGTAGVTRAMLVGGSAVRGGAIAEFSGELGLRNVAIAAQESAEQGGALFMEDGLATIEFAVLYRNPGEIGGGLALEGGDAVLRGVAFVGNAAEIVANAGPGRVDVDQSIVWGGSANDGFVGDVDLGPQVLYGDPRFGDPEVGDFVLRTGSPAIDLGVENQLDLDGTPADIGLYGGPDAWELPDADGDGYVFGRDCDDDDPAVHEGAVDPFYDGVDSNCDGADDFDQDGDGWRAAAYGGLDCDDTDGTVHPGADEEAGDQLDADCDGLTEPDLDGDGWQQGLDCDDGDASVYPGAAETWYDGVDADCDGRSDWDADGDGWDAASGGGADCDDADPAVHPGATDLPGDGVDADCNGRDSGPAAGLGGPGAWSGTAEAADPSGATSTPSGEADFPPGDPQTWATTTSCASAGGGGAAGGWLAAIGLLGLASRRRRRG